MSLKAMYKNLTTPQATADKFGSIRFSHEEAIGQISRTNLVDKLHCSVLDFGVGNGIFIQKLQKILPKADFTGIDISREMLKEAEKALPLIAIEASVSQASQLLPSHSQDLVLAHFVNAFIPLHILFKEADLLTKSAGYFSLITTTYESFPVAQQKLANFIAEGSLVSAVVGHYYKAMVKNTTVASNLQELLASFTTHQFDIVERHRIAIPITINSLEELTQFGLEGTWFLNSMSVRMLPKNFLIERLKRLFSKIFTFPYQDTHLIDVILAKKN